MYQLNAGQQEFEGPMEFISLAQLLKNSQIYERMPRPIQAALKQSVWLTLVTELLVLGLFILVPSHIWSIEVQAGGFFIEPMIGITGAAFRVIVTILPYVIALTLINLFCTLLILSISLFMILPVREPVHWLAALNSVPAWLNIILAGILGVLFGVLTVINIVLWVVLTIISIAIAIFVIVMILQVLGGILGSLFR